MKKIIFSASFVKVMIILVDLCGMKKKEIAALWLADKKVWNEETFFEIAFLFLPNTEHQQSASTGEKKKNKVKWEKCP